MNILVVEDERNLADAICKILEDAGYHTTARRGIGLRPQAPTTR